MYVALTTDLYRISSGREVHFDILHGGP